MHQTSELYKKIVADRFHKVECKLLIDGVEYYENDLVSIETENNLFAEEAPSCGNAVSGTITAELRTPNAVIRAKAKMELFARVTSGDLASEWIPKGVYFLDTREKKKTKNGEDTVIVLDGFDAILMGEQEYIPSGDWPKSDSEVLSEMCLILGVECVWHPDKNFHIQKPVGYSVREIIGYIAAMYGGSVTMDGSGRLKFVGLRTNQNYHDVVFSGISVGDKLSPITKVILHKMDGNKFMAGDDSGRTLNVDSPWASQEVADYILESVAGYEYQPFTATNVVIDPDVEIGDGLNFCGALGCCYQHRTVYFKSMISTIGAMEEKELDHDYKYRSSSSWGTGRSLAGLQEKTKEIEEECQSLVAEIEGVKAGMDAYVLKDAFEDYKIATARLFAALEEAGAALELKVESNKEEIDGQIQEIETAQAALTARVGDAEASIQLNAQEINGVSQSVVEISADVVELQGRVDLTGTLSVSGGRLSCEKSIYTPANVFANKFWSDTEEIRLGSNDYAPTSITSTTGPVIVLGHA